MKIKPEILNYVSSAPLEELRTVRNLLNEVIGNKAEPMVAPILADCISKMQKYQIPESLLPLWKKNAPLAEAFIKDTFKPRTRLAEHAITNLMVEILRDDLEARKIPPSTKVIIEHLPRLQEVFEHQFPGYIKSGLTSFLMKRLTRRK